MYSISTKMNRNIWLLLMLAFLGSCRPGKKAGEKDVITVSILPQKTFIEKIAGDDFKVNVLIPPGASPATYTLLPAQLKDISRSIAWFRIGHIGFEYSWKDKISQVNRNMRICDLSEGLDLITSGKGGNHGGVMHGVNPHTWLSPADVKKMAKRIRDVLSELNPDGAQKYQAGYLTFTKEIDRLNMQIKALLKDYKGGTIITFHPSFSYFARDYGLNQVSLEADGKEPTPKHIKEVVDLARAKNIKVIYIQAEFDSSHARLFANEIDGRVVQLSPLDPDWANNLLNMAKIMKENFERDK
ncbi:Zinc ABC transporter, substrate-binding protein ZnuA [hydrothermal vent metagenome]|uniref:Zinc ABC transporter, substrate-binding protein ZnuA n=1 Tax=hydrothermal vent metagenome TaxID=652676 RepID=A0A3B0UHT6_9ZZZZ